MLISHRPGSGERCALGLWEVATSVAIFEYRDSERSVLENICCIGCSDCNRAGGMTQRSVPPEVEWQRLFCASLSTISLSSLPNQMVVSLREIALLRLCILHDIRSWAYEASILLLMAAIA